MTDSNLTKAQWRVEIKQRLAALPTEDYRVANRRLETAFFHLNEVQRAVVVMIYYAVNREVATANLIAKLLSGGRRVALPMCTAGCNLVAKEIRSLAEMRPTGKFGLLEPFPAAVELAPDQIDLTVVPGVAFDRHGNRLGHGKGYYDRFLSSSGFRAFKMGLAYDFQLVERLPVDRYDIKIDAVLTPSVWYQCGHLD